MAASARELRFAGGAGAAASAAGAFADAGAAASAAGAPLAARRVGGGGQVPLERELPLLPGGRAASASAASPSLINEFNYEPPATRPLPPCVRWMQRRMFCLFLTVVYFGTALLLLVAYAAMGVHDDELWFLPCTSRWKNLFKYCSIPLVSILFTWWHVWLGIQMCFYPIEFRGWCKPYLGWQGIVPRRAHVMARRSCDIMVGTLITVEEIVSRIEPGHFFESLEPVLASTTTGVLTRLANLHFPETWAMLPSWCKDELHQKILEESRQLFNPVIGDLKHNINRILDIKQMSIDVLVANRRLLVQMFQQIGEVEFVFIQHTAAVMGFVLGVLQMSLWIALHTDDAEECPGPHFQCWSGYLVLPLSGLVIGYFTNWLAIQMIFRPVMPHVVCGGYVNIQGVFLKRQQQVAQELAAMICTRLIHARQMLEYIVQRDEVVEKVLDIYQVHLSALVDQTLGNFKMISPLFVTRNTVDAIKKDLVRETLAELPNHSREIEAYMDRAFALRDTLAYRLSRLHPTRFEGMLHPVFQEDEWMVLLLGGMLGVLVGLLQAAALGS